MSPKLPPSLLIDLSPRSRARVWTLTALGTLCCIAVAFALDSFSIQDGWRWGEQPINNVLIPLVLAPPFFFLLLNKLRELAEAHHELLVISSTDSLTCLYNRRAFTALVDAHLARSRAAGQGSGALLVIDVDHFKAVNDSFGHDRGDEALKLIAEAIRGVVRDSDVVGRLGGEEFCVFLPSGGKDVTEGMAERIRRAVHGTPFRPDGRNHPLSVSLGGAVFEREASFGELYRQADRRLYAAKQGGRDRAVVGMLSPVPAEAALLH